MKHAELLLPWVAELLAEAEANLAGLDAIVFGRGPGSFTSLRIGIGAVQGLAWGADLPVIPISSLAAVAQQVQVNTGQTIWVAMDARMCEVFHAQFQRNAAGELFATSAESVCAPAQLAWPEPESTIAAGTAFGNFTELDEWARKSIAVHAGMLPLAAAMLPLARQWLLKNKALPAAEAQPVYLRDNVADKPKAV
jgi:tRNA threonylcarbamoyladenosine biosynthesis protein TsaB